MTPEERAAQWIDRAMEVAGISQSELGRRMKQSPANISRLLSGRRDMRVSTLFAAIEGCEFEITELRVVRKKGATHEAQISTAKANPVE